MNSKQYILSNYPLQLQLNFIDLYKVEIINRLDQNPNLWKEFDYIVGDAIIEEYLSAHIDAETEKEKYNITQKFNNAIIESEQHDLIYATLIDFMEMVDQELYRSLCIDKWKDETFSPTFQKLLLVLHKIRPVFDIESVVDNLEQYSSELGQHYQPVIRRWENEEIDEEYAKSLIIRTLCILTDGATFHLLYAIYNRNVKAKEIIESIYPDFEIFYQKNVFEDRDGIVHFVYNGDNIANAIEDIMTNGSESKHAYNIFFGSLTPYHLRSLRYKIPDNPLCLHDYQSELAEKALKGENTLICAPTGSGKTVVAAYIIREHIFELQKNAKKAKIVFVVPTVTLVEQQTNQFIKFLGQYAQIIGIHGGSENLDFNSLLSIYDIIVLTPQILVNATDPKLCKLECIDRISLDAFTLIILDEVHHADKGDPYNKLMEEYHRCKYGDSQIPILSMPQVVGLTASLGSPNNPKTVDDVIKYTIKKCANFDAKSYTIFSENSAKLYSKIRQTEENTIFVKNNNEMVKVYYNYLQNLAESNEIYLTKIDGVLQNPAIFDGFCDIKNVEYKMWLSVTRSSTLKKAKLPRLSMLKANRCLEYLDLIYEAYQCAQLFPTEDTTELYLKNFGSKDGTDLDQLVHSKMLQLEKYPCSEPDIFKELVKCIKNQFNKDPKSKIIIFTPQRNYCKLGSEVIERYTDKKAIFISSGNVSCEKAGCNPSQQSEAIKKFKNGEIQILFATTILDEGLDVEECNLVIKYNLVTNNIAHIQRKGRARQILSESILITFEEKKKEKEEKNMEINEMIKEAYESLEKISAERKISMFENAIIEYNEKRVEKEKKEPEMIEKMSSKNADFRIHCGDCGAYITDSSNIRTCRSFYVPFDPEIWKLVKVLSSNPKHVNYKRNLNLGIFGSIYCKSVLEDGKICHGKLGNAANFKGIMLPCLGCINIKFIEKRNNEVPIPKKWKYLFYPDDISFEELLALNTFEYQPNINEVIKTLGKDSLVYESLSYKENSTVDES